MRAAIFQGARRDRDRRAANCQNASTISCVAGSAFGNGEIDEGQSEGVRVPLAGNTLVRVPGSGHSDDTLQSLLTLSDVMSTGHHAAVSAGVTKGDVVAVVGDGAVGLCAVLASARLGAKRIIALSRNPERQKVALELGATDIVEERGEAANEAVLDLTDGIGVDAALECVGTGQSAATAFTIARPGSTVGVVGVPHGVEVYVFWTLPYLAWVAFIPFSADLMGRYFENPVAMSFFAANVAMVSLLEWVLLWRAHASGLFHRRLTPVRFRWASLGSLAPVLIFLLSIPVMWIDTRLGLSVWILNVPVGFYLNSHVPEPLGDDGDDEMGSSGR